MGESGKFSLYIGEIYNFRKKGREKISYFGQIYTTAKISTWLLIILPDTGYPARYPAK